MNGVGSLASYTTTDCSGTPIETTAHGVCTPDDYSATAHSLVMCGNGTTTAAAGNACNTGSGWVPGSAGSPAAAVVASAMVVLAAAVAGQLA